jgi:hypothetical protein
MVRTNYEGRITMAKNHRQSISFSDEAFGFLSKLAEKRGVTVSEVVRTAINREAWFDNVTEKGQIYYKPDDAAAPHPVEFVD